MIPKLFRILVILLGCYLSLGLVIYIYQEKMLFQPGRGQWDSCPSLVRQGAMTISEPMGEKWIRGWHIPKPDAKGRIFLFHGNGGMACDRYFWVTLLDTLPVEIVLVEYPGYDGTEMSYTELLARGVNFFDRFEKINPLPSIAIGESLGTGLATYLAAERKLAGLVLYASYPSLVEVVRSKLGFYPIEAMLKYPMPAKIWAKKVVSPALLIHGTVDTVIPLHFGNEEALNFSYSTIYFIEGADHNNWTSYIDSRFTRDLNEFVLSHIK